MTKNFKNLRVLAEIINLLIRIVFIHKQDLAKKISTDFAGANYFTKAMSLHESNLNSDYVNKKQFNNVSGDYRLNISEDILLSNKTRLEKYQRELTLIKCYDKQFFILVQIFNIVEISRENSQNIGKLVLLSQPVTSVQAEPLIINHAQDIYSEVNCMFPELTVDKTIWIEYGKNLSKKYCISDLNLNREGFPKFDSFEIPIETLERHDKLFFEFYHPSHFTIENTIAKDQKPERLNFTLEDERLDFLEDILCEIQKCLTECNEPKYSYSQIEGDDNLNDTNELLNRLFYEYIQEYSYYKSIYKERYKEYCKFPATATSFTERHYKKCIDSYSSFHGPFLDAQKMTPYDLNALDNSNIKRFIYLYRNRFITL